MSSTFLNGLNTFGINSISAENNLLLGGSNTNNIQLLNPIIGNGDNNIILNNDTNIKGNTTINGNVSVNGIVTNSSPVTLTNQLTPKSYVDNTILESGTIIMHASLLNPPTGGTGYYLCDGSVKNTTTDSALFAVIGYIYGGSGNNFNLPNLLARFPVGPTTSSSMQYLNTLTGGNTIGTVTLSQSNLPPHTHIANSQTSTTITNSTQFIVSSQNSQFEGGGSGNPTGALGTFSYTRADTLISNVNIQVTHVIGDGPGTSTPFTITPPYAVIAYYIKR
jgi:microcystin-dependent protein